MKLAATARKLLVMLGTLGVLMPYPAMTRADDFVSTRHSSIQDLALQPGGVLCGQVANSENLPETDVEVTIIQRGVPIIRTTTNSRGLFAVGGLKGGVYVVSTDSSSKVLRAWSPGTAPPVASKGVLLVSSDLTIRGKGKDKSCGIGGLNIHQIGLGGLVVAGMVATVLAVTIDRGSSS